MVVCTQRMPVARLRSLQLSKRLGVRREARRVREAEEARVAAIKQAEAERWEAIQVCKAAHSLSNVLHPPSPAILLS